MDIPGQYKYFNSISAGTVFISHNQIMTCKIYPRAVRVMQAVGRSRETQREIGEN